MSLLTILLASLVGSLHCVGMCGPLVATLAGTQSGATGRESPARRLAVYHATRALTYGLLGVLAGWVGSGIELIGRAQGVHRFAALSMGTLLILLSARWAYTNLRAPRQLEAPPQLTTIRPHVGGARAWPSRARRWLFRTSMRPGWLGPFAAGLISGTLPCLWLWSYLLVAASSGSALQGGLLMFSFALGTVPALALVAFVAGKLTQKWAKRAPLLGALCLFSLGVASVLGWTTPVSTLLLPSDSADADAAAQCSSPVLEGRAEL